jgi:hypothetical protein
LESFKVHSKGFGTEIDITDKIKKSLINNDKDGIMKIYGSVAKLNL